MKVNSEQLTETLEANLTDPELYQPPEFSTQEKLALHELVHSDGWKVLTGKIWNHYAKQDMLIALMIPDDQRYYQGIFRGAKKCMDLAGQLEALLKEKQDPALIFDTSKVIM